MKRFKKIMSVIGNVFFGIIVLVVVLLIVSLGKQKITGGVPSVAGLHMYIVLSGSMNPAFDTGSLVFVKPTNPEKIENGDVITYKGFGNEKALVSHRVVEINNNVDGLSFMTKGDANKVIDSTPVPAEHLIGKIVLALPYVGYLLDFAKTKKGILTFILIPTVLLILYELWNLYKNLKKKKEVGLGKKGWK